MFTEFTRKRINEYVPDVYWVPIDINIVRFQIGCICTLTSFLRDHLGYRGCLKLKFRITLNQPNAFSAKIFVHTRTTTRFHEDTKTARSFVFDLSFYKRRATRSTPRPSFLPEARIQFTLHRLEQSFVIPRWTLQWIKKKEKILRRQSKANRAQLRSEIRSNEREREGKLWNAIFHRLTSGMPIIPLVVCHVDTHRVIPHRFHVVNSHVSILLLVAEHRIFTCDVNATWINGTNRYKRNGHFARRSKKERWVGGGERGKISLAHTHVSNSCTRKQYIYMG